MYTVNMEGGWNYCRKKGVQKPYQDKAMVAFQGFLRGLLGLACCIVYTYEEPAAAYICMWPSR